MYLVKFASQDFFIKYILCTFPPLENQQSPFMFPERTAL